MGAFDELLSAWRSNPDAETTLALCRYLGEEPHEDIVREVGARAEQWHANDADVMLAVGKMYLEAALLNEAQAALVAAGKINGRDSRPFRYLGEVLLRRGDAMRAEKVLKRAIELSPSDGDGRMWYDRAVVYVALQKRVGMQAVAAEVQRTLPKQTPSPPRRILSAATPPPPSPPPAPSRRPRPPPPPVRAAWPDEPTLPKSERLGFGARPHAAAAPAAFEPPTAIMASSRRGAQAAALAEVLDDETDTTLQQNVEPWPDRRPRTVPPPLPPPPKTLQGGFGGGVAPLPPRHPTPPTFVSDAPALAAEPRVPHASLEVDASGFDTLADDANPAPDIVLQHLARAGVYEPGGGAPPAWEHATPPKTRGSWVFVLATVLFAGAAIGGYAYARHVKEQRAELAERLGDEVQGMLHGGKPDELRATDDKLARIFDLDSRSPRAARLWLENRVLSALLLPDEPRGIDSAVHRGLTVGLEEKDVAFGKIASFLAEGDVAGAAALLPKYDKLAEKDPYFHLAAGAALDRAGDLRAIERYEAARALDPKLIAADVFLTRAVLLELGIEKGKKPLEELRKKAGDTPATRALSALAWAVDPDRPKELPKDAQIKEEERASLPAPLRAVPYVVEALLAINAGYEEKAASAIDSAIGLTDSPAIAAQLGFLAIKAGNEKLARKAALRALSFSALYPHARVLASRVALLGGRLDEAKKAIEELDPRSAEVAVVRAAIAYEIFDPGELRGAVEALGELTKQPEYEALGLAPGVMSGGAIPAPEKLEAIANPQVPWGELVAVDAAIESGNLELADKLIGEWGEAALSRPVYALRVSRLRRHQGKLDDALKASEIALTRGTTTLPVVIERVYALLAKDDHGAARDLTAKYSVLLGPMSGWLKAMIDSAAGRAAEAKVQLGQLEPPPSEAPVELRVLAMRALAIAKDKRAKDVMRDVGRQLPKHPELIAAAKLK